MPSTEEPKQQHTVVQDNRGAIEAYFSARMANQRGVIGKEIFKSREKRRRSTPDIISGFSRGCMEPLVTAIICSNSNSKMDSML
jgi:hypothetical protein